MYKVYPYLPCICIKYIYIYPVCVYSIYTPLETHKMHCLKEQFIMCQTFATLGSYI